MIDGTGLSIQFDIPAAGRYAIGVDYSMGLNSTYAVVLKIGMDGAPDEVVQRLHYDQATKRWMVVEGEI